MRPLLVLIQVLCVATLNAQAPDREARPKTDLRVGTVAVNRILFLGNSITLHAPAPDIGWTGNWGMAASSEDRDYVHLLVQDISKSAGGTPQIMVRNIADFERGLSKFKIEEQLQKEIDFAADVIIVAIGENAARPETPEANAEFRQAFEHLLQTFERHPHSMIVVRSQFWPDPAKDELMKAAAIGGKHTWVDLSGLIDESCYARSERRIDHAGVAGHPGDKGMQVIADAIMKAISDAGDQ